MSPLLLSAVLLLSAGPTVVAQKGAPNYDARSAFSRNGKIAAATVPGGIRVFDLTTRRMLVELPLPNAAEVAARSIVP